MESTAAAFVGFATFFLASKIPGTPWYEAAGIAVAVWIFATTALERLVDIGDSLKTIAQAAEKAKKEIPSWNVTRNQISQIRHAVRRLAPTPTYTPDEDENGDTDDLADLLDE